MPRSVTTVLTQVFPTAVFHHSGAEQVLTIAIDSGPDPATTLRIAATLRDADVPGVFFLLGARVEQHPDIVSRPNAQGHQIGAHFFEDTISALLSEAEVARSLQRTLAAIPNGVAVETARPGYGLPSQRLARVTHAAGLSLIVGDVPAFDTLDLPDWVYLSYLKLAVRPGSIVTFHDTGARGERTIRTLPRFIAWARSAGYRFEGL